MLFENSCENLVIPRNDINLMPRRRFFQVVEDMNPVVFLVGKQFVLDHVVTDDQSPDLLDRSIEVFHKLILVVTGLRSLLRKVSQIQIFRKKSKTQKSENNQNGGFIDKNFFKVKKKIHFHEKISVFLLFVRYSP